MPTNDKRNLELGVPDEVEPVRYVGGERSNDDYHDGRLRPVVGVHNYQVVRCNRTYPDPASHDVGWTYSHGPNIAFWRGRYYVQYLSNPVGEHTPPGRTLLCSSPDGVHWTSPDVVFPPYTLPEIKRKEYHVAEGMKSVMHQRMGFYVSSTDRLLVLGYYGVGHPIHPYIHPNDGKGVGRVVREVYEDGTYGPIYFIKYNDHAGFDESNTDYPFYKDSDDAGFVEACDELLGNRLVTLQWFEENRGPGDFFPFGAEENIQALSFYHRADGKVVALWKWSKAALSSDEGLTWSPIVQIPTFIMDGAKVWGQSTSDGRYAIVYNPTIRSNYRWPLAMVTGDDGKYFDDLLCINGEVPPRRFDGMWKDSGSQYVRGIVEGNGDPGNDMWVTYSVNKEDIWVSRIPIPVTGQVDQHVDDDFADMEVGHYIPNWNIYSPTWAPVAVVRHFDGANALELRDEEPYNYAKAERVFPECGKVTVKMQVLVEQIHEVVDIEILNRYGARPVRASLRNGVLTLADGIRIKQVYEYHAGRWFEMTFDVDTTRGVFDLSIDGETVAANIRFAEKVMSVERICFRTGAYRGEAIDPPPMISMDLPEADKKEPLTLFYIRRLQVSNG